MAIKLLGVQIVSFPSSKTPNQETATLVALYPLDNVDSPKFRRIASGRTTEAPFNKDPIPVNVAYAHKLIETGAFVSDKEYDLKFSFNEIEMTNEVTELVPVDAQLRDHFSRSMGLTPAKTAPKSGELKVSQ